MKRVCLVLTGALCGLSIAACEEREIEAPGEGSSLKAVREDAAALAQSTGAVLKEGLGELKEGRPTPPPWPRGQAPNSRRPERT